MKVLLRGEGRKVQYLSFRRICEEKPVHDTFKDMEIYWKISCEICKLIMKLFKNSSIETLFVLLNEQTLRFLYNTGNKCEGRIQI